MSVSWRSEMGARVAPVCATRGYVALSQAESRGLCRCYFTVARTSWFGSRLQSGNGHDVWLGLGPGGIASVQRLWYGAEQQKTYGREHDSTRS